MNPEGASCDRDKGCFVYSIDKIPKSMCQRVQQVFRGTGTFFRPKNIDKNDRLAREIVQLKSQDKSHVVIRRHILVYDLRNLIRCAMHFATCPLT